LLPQAAFAAATAAAGKLAHSGGRWQEVDLNVSPDRGYLLVATHGQGLWKIG
jgi:hypothetical protein